MNKPKAVIAPRGIPASGKTTWVNEQIAQSPPGTAARINNDDLVAMLYGPNAHLRLPETAGILESVRKKMLTILLQTPEIEVVFLDNTNLNVSALRRLETLAHQHGATFHVYDEFLSVPVDEAVRRDSLRPSPVGEGVVREMARKAKGLTAWNFPKMPTIEPYHNDHKLPSIIIVDIDGTLAEKSPERDIHDYHLVHLDTPIKATTNLITQLVSHGWKVVVMSGRKDDSRQQTQDWLNKHVAPDLPLLMRSSKDHRPDWIVKYELFQEHIADKYHVHFVLDDRDQVVALWRDKLKLPTWQVAHGDF